MGLVVDYRQVGEVWDPDSCEAVYGSVVAGHGSGDGSVQTEEEGHPRPISARDQPNVRVMIRPVSDPVSVSYV